MSLFPLNPQEVGTLGQWAAPFITFGLTFLKRSPKAQKSSNVEEQVKTVIAHLGAKRVHLLKCIELRSGHPDFPESYAGVVARFSGDLNGTDPGWGVAARYACEFLSLLNLVEYRGSEVVISPLGRAFLNSEVVRADFSGALAEAAASCGQRAGG